jgi:hypothetical protein
MDLPVGRVQHEVARVPAVAGGAVGRLENEVAGIWRDARALSRRSALPDGRPGERPDQPQRELSSQQVYFAWYGGLAAMALLRIIEWRLAGLIAAVHTVERYAHRRRVREFFEGIDAGGL